MGRRHYLRSFAGGEVSPELWGRIDDVKFQTGLATARNLVTLPHGPVRERPGFRYVGATKSNGVARLIPFQFSRTQALQIEFGAGYFRFWDNGSQVTFPTPDNYVANETCIPSTGVSTAADTLQLGTPHDFQTGDRICITPDSVTTAIFTSTPCVLFWTAEAPVYYYAIRVDANNIKIATSEANATSGVAVDITILGSGTFYRVHRAYAVGDLVHFPGNGKNYYVKAIPISWGGTAYLSVSDPTNTTYWHELTGSILEVPNSYAEADLFEINVRQSNDVVKLTHRDYPPSELQRRGSATWAFTSISFGPALGTPSAPTLFTKFRGDYYTIENYVGQDDGTARYELGAGTPRMNIPKGATVRIWDVSHSGGVGSDPLEPGFYIVEKIDTARFNLRTVEGHLALVHSYTSGGDLIAAKMAEVVPNAGSSEFYKVTAVDIDGRESLPSDELEVENNLFVYGAYNEIEFDAVEGADHYMVYKLFNGVYGWIGRVNDTGASSYVFKDENIDPKLDRLPPIQDDSLSGTDYPQAVAFFQQRVMFGGSALYPQQIWGTRTGTQADLSLSVPTRATDRLSYSLSSHEADYIQHLVSLGSLVALTSSSEYIVSGPEGEPLTPDTIRADWQAGRGSSLVSPIVVDNLVVYAANRGGRVLALGYDLRQQGFAPIDLSIRATHLFDGQTIVDSAITKAPHQTLWFVSSSGELLGLTFMPGQEVAGWHRHTTGDTAAVFESISAISEGDEDILYAVVKRVIDGSTVRYIERMAPMIEEDIEEMILVDSAFELPNAAGIGGAGPFSGVTGGWLHLAGETVSILADGIVLPQQEVSATGHIDLGSAVYSKVIAGLPIDYLGRTLPVSSQIEAFAQGRVKSVDSVWLRVIDSGSFEVGQDLTDMRPTDESAAAQTGALVAEVLADKVEQVTPDLGWSDDGMVYFRQTNPLPMRIAGMTIEVTYGG